MTFSFASTAWEMLIAFEPFCLAIAIVTALYSEPGLNVPVSMPEMAPCGPTPSVTYCAGSSGPSVTFATSRR